MVFMWYWVIVGNCNNGNIVFDSDELLTMVLYLVYNNYCYYK